MSVKYLVNSWFFSKFPLDFEREDLIFSISLPNIDLFQSILESMAIVKRSPFSCSCRFLATHIFQVHIFETRNNWFVLLALRFSICLVIKVLRLRPFGLPS